MGHVTEAQGERKMGRGGKLHLTLETVTAGDGRTVRVSGERTANRKGGYPVNSSRPIEPKMRPSPNTECVNRRWQERNQAWRP